MKLSKTLSEKRIKLNLQGTCKTEIISELVALAVAEGSLRNGDEFTKKVLEREALYSTGLAEGIAIPHAQDADVEDVITCIGICREGVEFDAADGKPVQVIFLIAANTHRDAPYLVLLSQIVHLLGNVSVREQVLAAQSAHEVIQIITKAEALAAHGIHGSCEEI